MGQCPSLPPAPHGYAEDDEHSITRSETGGSGTGMPFLVEHSFEDNDRSILDKSDVMDSFEYQASIDDKELRDERTAGALEQAVEQEETNHSTETTAASSPRAEEMFSNAPTEATRKISNVDRTAPKEKFRARAEAARTSAGRRYQPMGGISEGEVFAGQGHLRDMRSFGSYASFVEQETPAESANMALHRDGETGARGVMAEYRHRYQSHITYDDKSDVSDLNMEKATATPTQVRCLGPLLPSACLSGVYGKLKGGRAGSSDASSNVLELKWKAKLIGDYQREYEREFPNNVHSKRLDKASNECSRRKSDTRDGCIAPRPITYALDDASFLDLALTGSLGLVESQQSSSRYKKDYLILKNIKKDTPIAVCALKSPHEAPVVRVYAAKPRIAGQIPAASTSDIGLPGVEVDLYAWAEFATEGEFPFPVRYSIYLSTGEEGKYEKEPSYKGSHPVLGSPDISVVGRTSKELIYRGCCLLSVHSDENNDEEPLLGYRYLVGSIRLFSFALRPSWMRLP